MTSVGVRELKANLSRYLRQVKQGATVQITEHGRPIAVINGATVNPEIEALWRMVAAGEATWNGGKPRGSDNPPRVTGKTAAARIIEDRQ